MTLITANTNWKLSLQIQDRNFQFIVVLLKNEFNSLSSVKNHTWQVHVQYQCTFICCNIMISLVPFYYSLHSQYFKNYDPQSIFKRIWHDCREFRLYVLYLQCSYKLKLHFNAYWVLCFCAYCMNVNKVFSYTTRICFKTNCQLTNYLNQLYWWQYSYTSFDFCNYPINIVLMYFVLLHN